MNWTLLTKTSQYTEAAIIQGRLEENQVPVQVLNKMDSMYLYMIPGMIEIYVPASFLAVARGLLDENISN